MSAKVAIFGATSAIAMELAREYARTGAQLYLVGRNASKLDALATSLGTAVVGHAQQDFDVTGEAGVCVSRAIASLGGLDVAVLAHGLLGDQLQSESNLQVAEQIAHTNYASAIALLIPLANYFEQRGGGHLAVLSTVAADRGRPRNYTYAAAKSALNTYLQGLRSRLYARGVQVHTIKLGPVDTPMTVDHEKNLLFAKAPDVARGIRRAIERGQSEAYVPRFWQPIMFAVRNLPEPLFQRVRALSGR
ncbi:MAG TPA: SDR family NAD(P)-dependent oxidoreductase [Polyangiales bacterium]